MSMGLDVMKEEDLRRIIKEELSNINITAGCNNPNNNGNNGNNNGNSEEHAETTKKTKSKRAPSKWNLFLKECSQNQPKELSLGERTKLCSVEYKQVKDQLNIDENGNLIKP